MKNAAVKALEDGAIPLATATAATTATGSWLGVINGNAPAIGLLLTLIFGGVGLYFQWKRSRESKADANEKLIHELQQEIKLLKSE